MSTHDDKDSQTAELLDHNYDGIQEYDNTLPAWWLAIFLGSIIFAFIYYIHYTFGGAPTQVQELAAELKALPKPSGEKTWNEDDLKAKMSDHENLEEGKAVFASKCAACHGVNGQGVIGPNLTDNYWIHGQGKRADLMTVITKGVTEKGMPAWGEMISEKEVLSVAGYVYSLRGTKPANPKPPQGEEVKE